MWVSTNKTSNKWKMKGILKIVLIIMVKNNHKVSKKYLKKTMFNKFLQVIMSRFYI